jgi:hypothetical protein
MFMVRRHKPSTPIRAKTSGQHCVRELRVGTCGRSTPVLASNVANSHPAQDRPLEAARYNAVPRSPRADRAN